MLSTACSIQLSIRPGADQAPSEAVLGTHSIHRGVASSRFWNCSYLKRSSSAIGSSGPAACCFFDISAAEPRPYRE